MACGRRPAHACDVRLHVMLCPPNQDHSLHPRTRPRCAAVRISRTSHARAYMRSPLTERLRSPRLSQRLTHMAPSDRPSFLPSLQVNLIMDSMASLALATEAPTDDILDGPPVQPEQPLVSATVAKHIAGQATWQLAVMGSLMFGGQAALAVDAPTCNTILFNAFVMMQLFNQVRAWCALRPGGQRACAGSE